MSAYPSDHKISITVDPMGGIHLSDCTFTVNLIGYRNTKISIPKEKCIKENDDTYIVLFNTKKLGPGRVAVSLNIQIPDPDFENNIKDVNTRPIWTGVEDR